MTNLSFIIILLSFPLGQLTRMEPIAGVRFYLHDVGVLLLWIQLARDRAVISYIRKLPLAKPILMFIAAGFISLLVNLRNYPPVDLLLGSMYLFRWIFYAGVYFFLKNRKQKQITINLGKKSFTLIEAMQLAGVSAALIGFLQYFWFFDLTQFKWLGWDDHLGRLTGTILDPGFMGILLVLTFITFLIGNLPQKSQLFSLSITGLAILLTYSRASYMAFLAGVSYILLRSNKRKVLLLVVGILLISLPLLPKARSEGTNLLRIYSLEDRLQSWGQGMDIFLAHPILGVGMNMIRSEKINSGIEQISNIRSHSAPGIENSFIFVLATTGAVGLIAFLWLIFSMMKSSYMFSEVSQSILVTSSIIATSVHAIFTNTWFYPWVMLWFWMLIGANCRFMEQTE